jgi:hypothetical protein
MDGACSKHGEKINAHKILVGKSEEKRPLGRPRSRLNEKKLKCILRKRG